ncbi:unnamed protein product [Moneuplotes crassus]|uniref:Uncharacterized protein n=1 Tax=Euplotes crassus TaxID=5936 RepID=A0AAD1UNB1_EUPCR|nr:unnamed protein product [Moneuplotes crassus]
MEETPDSMQAKLAHVRSLEKSVLEKSKREDYKRSKSLHFNMHSEEIHASLLNSDVEFYFTDIAFFLYFDDLRYMKFAKKLRHLAFFDINNIVCCDILDKNKHIYSFLNSSFPHKVNSFWISSKYTVKLDPSYYFDCIMRNSSSIIQSVGFAGFCFNDQQLKRLITSFKHVRLLSLQNCNLCVLVVHDFSKSLKNAKIKKITLLWSGQTNASDWKNNLDGFKNLIKSLATSQDLKLTLKEINMRYCSIGQEKALKILKENGLSHIKVLI